MPENNHSLADRLLLHFEAGLNALPDLPPGVEWLLPLTEEPETRLVFRAFVNKFYSDNSKRILILGINPGRFGAGITNVAFTDPVHLERDCGISNSFQKREELSAQFVYEVIRAWGGTTEFYRKFFINSVVPYGFVKDGKNFNYYDSRALEKAVEPFAGRHIKGLQAAGMNSSYCICFGEGKNFVFLNKLNQKHGLFEEVIPLPHPRFIMQYKRKSKDAYINRYMEAMQKALT